MNNTATTSNTYCRKYTVSPQENGLRLDAFWAKKFAQEGISRSKIQNWIKSGYATVDGHIETKQRYIIGTGSLLKISGQTVMHTIQDDNAPLDILYKDKNLLIINKPSGLITHPAPSCPSATLVNRLVAHYPELKELDPARPGIVHRLDKDTSGLMVIARNEKTRLKLSASFAQRTVDKIYLALCHGLVPLENTEINLPIGRDPRLKTRMAVAKKGGKPAKSLVKALWHDPVNNMSLVAVKIFTGRTHQVRVHLATFGHPLLGDTVYGSGENALWKQQASSAAKLCTRQMLHAFYLGFTHPETDKKLCFTCPPPEDFMQVLQACQKSCLRVGVTGTAGSGKSALLAALAKLDAPTFSADACVNELYKHGQDGAVLLASRFGSLYQKIDGGVDKIALLKAMRESENLRQEVMNIIHPIVLHRIKEFFVKHREENAAFAEIPLLAETAWTKKETNPLDFVLGVDCPEELRCNIRRKSRNMTAETLALLDSWQWTAKQKLALCDMVIDNSGSLHELNQKALKIIEKINSLQAKQNLKFQKYIETLLSSLPEDIL